MSFDKFRYYQGKEERKQKQAQKQKELKQVRISPRAALNDLQIRAKQADEFLKEGHKVEVGIFLRGREKGNKEWALQKMREFLTMISVPHEITMGPRQGGRGFVAQIAKNRSCKKRIQKNQSEKIGQNPAPLNHARPLPRQQEHFPNETEEERAPAGHHFKK